jgi:RNA polymerase sigma-70 factor (ECF subfamily)
MTGWLADRFEENRSHLRGVAYRMLGSLDDAEDAVQEAWLRLGRQESGGIENLGGWLTTVVARICVDMLRARRAKREELLEPHIPDFIVSREESPEDEVLMADSVGLALLVVLDSLRCRSKRSHRSSTGRRRRPVNSRAAHAGACRERRRQTPV